MPFFFHSESQFFTYNQQPRNLPLFTYNFNTGIFLSIFMQADQDILGMVIKKFPKQANRMTKLFCEDENFREICEDYVLCLHSMNKIIVTNRIHNRIMKEYKATLNELELEMLTYINNTST